MHSLALELSLGLFHKGVLNVRVIQDSALWKVQDECSLVICCRVMYWFSRPKT